jgi:hypothetical protein
MMILRFTIAVALAAAVLFLGARTASVPAYGAADSRVSFETPPFVVAGKRYAFTWAGGGPAQTYTVKAVRPDGWVLVDVAEENVNPVYLVPGEFPTRWLNVALAISIQEMRPHIQ